MAKKRKALHERPQGVLPSNTIPNPREDIKIITIRSGMTLVGLLVPSPFSPSSPSSPSSSSSSKEVKRDPKTIPDQVLTESTTRVPTPVVQPSPVSRSYELPPFRFTSSVILERNLHQPLIPYPSSFPEALAYTPKYARMLSSLKSFPGNLENNRTFLIPYEFQELESYMALADLGASINLMPLSVWEKLILLELTPTRMTLELATQTVSYPACIAEDVLVKVGKFTFPADFVVVDYDVDPRVPFILRRPFLRMACALVDIHDEEFTLCVCDEKLVFNVESTSKYPRKHGDESIHMIDILDTTCEDYFHKEKSTFTCPYGTFAYRRMPFSLCKALGTFQRYMVAIFHDMIEKTMEVFMDDFSVFGDSFSSCLSHLNMMLKWCEDTNLILNGENCHFMVKEGIVLDHKIFKSEIRDKKGAENLAADHLRRLENPHKGDLIGIEMNDNFPHKSLNMISLNPHDEPSWFVDIANYLVGNVLVRGMSSKQKKKFFKDVRHYF
uniref:Reverse transcriptase domain-containing protein n=1 Tax=Tanacetum cinerariifolium TaxID=118510 RepID=A0A6L2LQL5_TANCI|nr:reverse transcriptase domain-containing protein [Tanacetum cinerariifolium]